jgi:hypothetical protein
VSNTATLVNPLVGYDAYISSFAFNDTQAFVELFNPTLVTLSLDDYRLVINDTNYFFQEGLTLPASTDFPLLPIRQLVTHDARVYNFNNLEKMKNLFVWDRFLSLVYFFLVGFAFTATGFGLDGNQVLISFMLGH